MKATALKRRSNIIATAFAAASVMFMPQAVKAGALEKLFASLISPHTANPGAAPLGDKTLVLYLSDGTIRNTAGEIVVDKVISGAHREKLDARNNSKYEAERKIGPLPAGLYGVRMPNVSPPSQWEKLHGKWINKGGIDRPVMHLEPIGATDAHGRSAFLIHEILTVKYGEDGTEGCVGTADEKSYERLEQFRKTGQFKILKVVSSFEPAPSATIIADIRNPVVTEKVSTPSPKEKPKASQFAEVPVKPIPKEDLLVRPTPDSSDLNPESFKTYNPAPVAKQRSFAQRWAALKQ